MNNLKEEILQNLKDNDGIWRPSSGYISVKCPFCDQTSSKRHFNICIQDDSPMIFRCFRARCGVAGVLNKKIARRLGINNRRLLDYIEDEFVKGSKYKTSSEFYSNDYEPDIDEDYVGLLGMLSDDTEEYFKTRTNTSARENQYLFRICDDLHYFYKYNKQRIDYSRIEWLLKSEKMGNKYIYFFNDRYSMFIYRQTNGDRKGKISLMKRNILYKHKPYTIERTDGMFDITKDTKTLFIAEGVFDIINTYFYLGRNVNGHFIASGGFSATKNIIMDYSKYNYKPHIVIISDGDVPLHVYQKWILKHTDKRISHLDIHYNKNAKDIGNIQEGITLVSYKLK